MLCPRCGHKNADNAGRCSNCKYNFRLGHAYNDPRNMTFVSLGNSKKTKFIRYIFFSVFFVIFILIIAAWIKSL